MVIERKSRSCQEGKYGPTEIPAQQRACVTRQQLLDSPLICSAAATLLLREKAGRGGGRERGRESEKVREREGVEGGQCCGEEDGNGMVDGGRERDRERRIGGRGRFATSVSRVFDTDERSQVTSETGKAARAIRLTLCHPPRWWPLRPAQQQRPAAQQSPPHSKRQTRMRIRNLRDIRRTTHPLTLEAPTHPAAKAPDSLCTPDAEESLVLQALTHAEAH